jgi:hypothetical protein
MQKIHRLLLVVILSLPASQLLTGTTRAEEPKEPASIAGTEWVGMDNPERFIITYRFEEGGVVAYAYGGNSYRNGTWKQDGKKVYFELNNKFRELEATIEGEVITGDSWNTRNLKWRTTLYKYNRPKRATEVQP